MWISLGNGIPQVCPQEPGVESTTIIMNWRSGVLHCSSHCTVVLQIWPLLHCLYIAPLGLLSPYKFACTSVL